MPVYATLSIKRRFYPELLCERRHRRKERTYGVYKCDDRRAAEGTVHTYNGSAMVCSDAVCNFVCVIHGDDLDTASALGAYPGSGSFHRVCFHIRHGRIYNSSVYKDDGCHGIRRHAHALCSRYGKGSKKPQSIYGRRHHTCAARRNVQIL